MGGQAGWLAGWARGAWGWQGVRVCVRAGLMAVAGNGVPSCPATAAAAAWPRLQVESGEPLPVLGHLLRDPPRQRLGCAAAHAEPLLCPCCARCACANLPALSGCQGALASCNRMCPARPAPALPACPACLQATPRAMSPTCPSTRTAPATACSTMRRWGGTSPEALQSTCAPQTSHR